MIETGAAQGKIARFAGGSYRASDLVLWPASD